MKKIGLVSLSILFAAALVLHSPLATYAACPSLPRPSGSTTVQDTSCTPAGNYNLNSGDEILTVTGNGIIDANVNGKAGNDRIVIKNDGTVTGDVSGGAGDDTLVVKNDGVVGGDVKGGSGSDLILVKNGGVVVGDVKGGADADKIVVSGGLVIGTVSGGKGDDLIIVKNGGDVISDVSGGKGDDDIYIGATGTVLGNVLGGSGSDLIFNNGEVDGTISGDGGSNIVLNSGLVGAGVLGGFSNNIIDADQQLYNTSDGIIYEGLVANFGVNGAHGDNTIFNDGTIGGDINDDGLIGNYAIFDSADGSNVIVNTGTVDGNVVGNQTVFDSVPNDPDIVGNAGTAGDVNTITNSGTINGYLIGNYFIDAGGDANYGTAEGDNVIVNSNYVGIAISGNVSFGGDAIGNNTITNTETGTVNGDISGNLGLTADGVFPGNALGNNTITNAGTVDANIYGNFANLIGDATGDNVIVNTATGSIGQSVYGNDAFAGDASGNNFIQNDGDIAQSVFGNLGVAFDDPVDPDITDFGNAAGNNTIINNSHVGGFITGNYSSEASATGDNVIINNGLVDGAIYGNWSVSEANPDLIQVEPDGNAHGDTTIINNGTVKGGIFAPGDSTNTATVMINGPVGDSSVLTTDAIVTTGRGPDNIVVNNTVYGSITAGGGSDVVTITPNGNVTGIISGDNNLLTVDKPDGTSWDTLRFAFGNTTNEGEWEAFKNGILASSPHQGSITFRGKTYSWINFDELQNLLNFILIVTWFNPGDNRYDGRPGDRLAVYCHADQDKVGVLLINSDSKGDIGQSFKISALEKLGAQGTSVDFGVHGVLSIMIDDQGNGYAAWNGGDSGATGVGDFSKLFTCG